MSVPDAGRYTLKVMRGRNNGRRRIMKNGVKRREKMEGKSKFEKEKNLEAGRKIKKEGEGLEDLEKIERKGNIG